MRDWKDRGGGVREQQTCKAGAEDEQVTEEEGGGGRGAEASQLYHRLPPLVPTKALHGLEVYYSYESLGGSLILPAQPRARTRAVLGSWHPPPTSNEFTTAH